MSANTVAGTRRMGTWRLHHRRERHSRQIGPIVEVLERRLALTTTPHALGVAYQQVEHIRTMTLHSLGDSYREVQAAAVRFASRTAVAIDELKAELVQDPSHDDAEAIAAAIRRNRHWLDRVGAAATRVEQGLDVGRGLADEQANADKTNITNGLFTNLAELVRQDQSTSVAIIRSGRRSEKALILKLDKLGDQLTSTIR